MKNKVLFVATINGHIECSHLPYLKLFKDKGWQTHVATGTPGKISKYVDIKHTLSICRNPFKLDNLKAIKQMKQLLEKEHFDIIHCHTPMGSVVTRLAAKKARKNGTRVIYTAHGFHFYTGAPLINWLLFYPVEWYLAKYTDTLITINHEDYNRAKKKFGKRCHDIQYVPGVGIDPKKFDFKMTKQEKHELRASLGLKDDDFVMIFPARLDKNKNQSLIIDAMAKIKNNKIHLLLPGKDEVNGFYQKYTKSLGLNNNVHFLGRRDDVPKLLRISNIAVSSSLREGLGLNVIEAIASGIPVIAVRNRGHNEIINSKNGTLINNSAEELSQAISLYYNDIDSWYNYKKTSTESIDKFYLKNVVKKMAYIYGLNRKKER